MSTLEFRFGRPECLVQSQLRKVRETGQISESKVDLIVEFATKVQNLTAFLEASGMHQYLMDPLLLDELIGKLPMSRRLEWAQSSMLIQPCATIKHFSEWLNRLSRIICLATTTSLSLSSQARSEARPRTGRVLHAD